ncbi:hypothetical protein MMC29_000780 [Sticta canariensis]|nr:hypothetical protein [Sticta canariensis]
MALRIKKEVNEVINPSEVRPDEDLVWNKLEITFYSIFVFASIELLTLAMWIVSRQRKQANPTWIGIYLAFLVAVPLLIRSLYTLGFLAAGLTHYIKVEAGVAADFITNICFILVYIGVLLVAMRFKKKRAGLGHPGNFGHPQMGAGTWTYPASVQHQTYPPQGSQYSGSTHPFLGHETAPNGGAPLGDSSYSSRQQPTDSTTAGRGYPQPPRNDAVTPYQAQSQYNDQHTPGSPVLRENSLPHDHSVTE